MTIRFGPNKLVQCLKAIMSITMLASLAGTLILARDAEARTAYEELSDRLTKLEIQLDTTESRLNATIDKLVPIGTILPFGGPVEAKQELEEKGWLFCDGRKLERQRYPELYEKIGVAFGKPDENTFNLPDLRGRFVRGVDHDAGRDPDVKKRTHSAEGGNSNDKVGSIQEDDLAHHVHYWQGFYRGLKGFGVRVQSESQLINDNNPPNQTTKKDGGAYRGEQHGSGAEARPKNIYVNWIIKAKSR